MGSLNVHEVLRYALLLALGICAYLLVRQWTADYSNLPPVTETEQTTEAVEIAESTPERLTEQTDIPIASEPSSDVPDASLVRTNTSNGTGTSQSTAVADLVKVNTPLLNVWIDPLGGDIRQVQLPQHPVSLDYPDVPVTLLQKTATHTYIAQSGLVGEDGFDATGPKPRYVTRRLSYEVDTEPADVVLVATREVDGGAVVVRKTFTFYPDQYLIEVNHRVENQSSRAFRANLFAQLTHDGQTPESTAPFMGPRPYVGAALTTPDSRYDKIAFDDVEEEQLRQEVNGGWIAILQHYFLSTWVPNDQASYLYYGLRDSAGRYRFGFTGPETVVEAGDRADIGLRFYVGPKVQRDLKAIAEHLELTVDYGLLWFLSMPLFYVLEFSHSLVGNWGVAIILLTIVIKLVLYPLSAMSYKSMAKMRTVTPQIKRLQERFGGDRQRLSQEMMALYRKEGANPMTGCLPMLAQLPVFIALYWVLYESVELRQAPFILWIKDLSVMDPYFVLPILMGASMFFMQMLNPPMPDPMQQKMMRIMPILFTVLFVFFPAGLVLYWLMNNILSYAQQFYTTKRIEAANAAKCGSG